MQVLKEQRRQQAEWKLAAGPAWHNEHDLVFTNELGGHLCHTTVYQHFKKLVKKIGMDETRFHDLRHSTAILALQNGCSTKVVQELLGEWVCQGEFSNNQGAGYLFGQKTSSWL